LLTEQTADLMEQSEIVNKGINDILSVYGVTLEEATNMSDEELLALGMTPQTIADFREYRDKLYEINN
jgi:hypothetical protein